ncbi:MAG: PQQ-binding-like beta-propeller repeat protein [Paracoccaceae bacterium]
MKVCALSLMALLALSACAPREVILPGERFPIRADLRDSIPVEGEPAPVAPPADSENQSVPISLPGAVANADWTHRGGNAQHNQPHGSLSAAPQLLFAANIGTGNSRRNRIAAAPVVADGRVFTIDAAAQLVATGTNGATLWQTDLTALTDAGGGLSGGGLAYGGGRVFATTPYGEIVALDPATGAIQWRQALNVSVTGAPATDGNTVYVAGRDGAAWAIAADDGRVQWTAVGLPAAAGVVGSAAPAVGDRAVIFPFAGGVVSAFLKTGGTAAWTAPVAGQRLGRAFGGFADVTGDPVIENGVIYIGTSAGRTLALSASGGTEIWSAGEGAMGPILSVGGSLFMVNDKGDLVRLDQATGEKIWTQPLPFFENDNPRRQKAVTAHFGPVLAGGRIVVASGDGQLRFFSPNDGASLGSVEIPGGAATQPALAGGVLYVVSASGQLLAFR